MKHCPKCNQEKPFEAFYASSTHKSGYASWCKECESERNRLKSQKYRDSRLAKAKQWRDENKEKQAVAQQPRPHSSASKHPSPLPHREPERRRRDALQAERGSLELEWLDLAEKIEGG